MIAQVLPIGYGEETISVTVAEDGSSAGNTERGDAKEVVQLLC